MKGRFGSIEKVAFMKGDAATIEYSVKNQKFDVITCLDVLEQLNIEGTRKELRASARLLKDDRILVTTVHGFLDEVRIALGKSPAHRHSLSSYGWLRICRVCGFRVKSVETVEFPFVHSDFQRGRVHLLGKYCLIVAE
jgi:hypothetical protein